VWPSVLGGGGNFQNTRKCVNRMGKVYRLAKVKHTEENQEEKIEWLVL